MRETHCFFVSGGGNNRIEWARGVTRSAYWLLNFDGCPKVRYMCDLSRVDEGVEEEGLFEVERRIVGGDFSCVRIEEFDRM